MVNRAEELITQLEAEIVKRDARIAELEAELETTLVDWGTLRLEIATLKAQPSAGVVLPERDESFGSAELDEYANGYRHGWNAYHDAAKERLNPCRAQPVPNLVECDRCPTSGGCVEVCMRAQQKESGDE